MDSLKLLGGFFGIQLFRYILVYDINKKKNIYQYIIQMNNFDRF
jgi:hypothetical protein